MNFVGYKYSRQVPQLEEAAPYVNGTYGLDEDTPPASTSGRGDVWYPDVNTT
jgi:hypothetical protein